MIDFRRFDRRPVLIALAGPNGAGKSTFYFAHLQQTGLRFVNADHLARELDLDPYAAAEVAERLRAELFRTGESFIFETVFSDPVGRKLNFLKQAVEGGYLVILCFIGIPDAGVAEERVAMRISQGGHDVPLEKLAPRFERCMENLRRAVAALPYVLVYDNSNLNLPYRHLATFEGGRADYLADDLPAWFLQACPRHGEGP